MRDMHGQITAGGSRGATRIGIGCMDAHDNPPLSARLRKPLFTQGFLLFWGNLRRDTNRDTSDDAHPTPSCSRALWALIVPATGPADLQAIASSNADCARPSWPWPSCALQLTARYARAFEALREQRMGIKEEDIGALPST